MTREAVGFELDDHVAVVTFQRPELNVFDLETRDAFIEAIAAARDHPDVRAVLIRADGKHFSAGADLREFGTAPNVFEARRIRWARDPWLPLWELPQPTIVALHGFALGAGLEMALLCDIRLAARDTKLGLPETRLGMLPAAGGSQSLPRVVRPAVALPMLLASELIDADEARRRGVVHAVADDVEGEALEGARRMARLPCGAARAAKRAVRMALDLPLREGLVAERRLATLTALNPGCEAQ